ncbi:hypothetical protein CH253_25860 [Rhodococcus sp. 06-156-3C]|uniref:hypothetical protein n=1 Tax=Nocardiaceae TaxID=85025 RepID=UPI000522E36B|nr:MULTISPECIES: hypothetical protein [Rhodococcus]OZD12119.1 hypothetical protein CH253_25860 [Rhodococcus sp. 06-156-3C]OZD19209.1 hypothetical protein CH280_05985 [Rhodococcus sp. 06-156-4C]OZD20744.1 hypothetical protein CH248_10735 [Rhodococcus sp. 06-156-4a]OZD28920.1 hypothetical protein CH247_18330 [Rhodococcus sp. 06-156-3b]OZD33477.1 hypothetical protein CH284_17800 [Rhodococcus sp. 06-156-3]
MDKRQSIASSGVDAVRSMYPDRDPTTAWAPAEKACFDAGAAYLAAMEQYDGIETGPAQAAFQNAAHLLGEAAKAVDRFYAAHRDDLEQARSALAATPRLAQDATALAEKAQLAVASADPAFVDYPSIRSAWRGVDTAVAALDAAMSSKDAPRARTAAAAVREAAEELESAVAAAPGRVAEARAALTSVKTRVEAVRTRFDRLAPAFSALLREFNVASSADLSHNEQHSARHIEQAEEDLSAARASFSSSNPEQALEYIAQARSHLSDAEELVDAVTDRLELLREVKLDSTGEERAVRFKLRDAQQLAVNRSLVAEWGSVLDAQLARIDRATATLTGTHPDYWSYLQDLRSISGFISGVIDRMRGSAR